MSDNNLFRTVTAKLRNLFCVAKFIKRNADGTVQVQTHNGVTLRDKQEAFPYGFYAKAKSGKTLVFCQAGSYNDFEIMPILKDKNVLLPELKEGDAALYTGNGALVIVREKGGIEIKAKESEKIFIGNNEINMHLLLEKLVDEIKNLVTSGSPASQTINAASKAKLDLYKNEIKKLYAEAE